MIEEHRLFFGLPIQMNEKVSIIQPTLKTILQKDFPLERILEPFISLDKQNFNSETDNEKLTNFDMFFVQALMGYVKELSDKKDVNDIVGIVDWIKSDTSQGLVVKRLIESLKLIFNTNDVELCVNEGILSDLDENYIVIDKSYKIDRNTYDSLRDTICEIFDTEIKIEKKREISEEEDAMNKLFAEKQKKYEDEYGAKQKKEKNKDKPSIFTLVNYIIHNKISQYNYSSVQELTIYQIKNTFKYYQSLEMYETEMSYRTSGNFKIDKKSTDHWFFDK